MHTTVQTLGRVAIIGGTVLVALINLYLFSGTENLPEAQKVDIYRQVFEMALAIPAISVAGVVIAEIMKRRHPQTVFQPDEKTDPNWWILGGGLVFVVFSVTMGLADVPYNQEIIFAGSISIVSFLMVRLTRELDPVSRETLIGTAIVIFFSRSVPLPGPGVSW